MTRPMEWHQFKHEFDWLAVGMSIGRLSKADFCDEVRALLDRYEGGESL